MQNQRHGRTAVFEYYIQDERRTGMADQDKIINGTFDYRKIEKAARIMPMITIYEHPDDYPDKYVARVWDANEPTHLITLADTLDEIRKTIPQNMVLIQKCRTDEPCIVELWI